VTGTDVGKIMGCDEYCSRKKLLESKILKKDLLENASPFTKTLLSLGNQFENPALLECRRCFSNLKIGKDGFVPGMSPHNDYSWFTGTPDYIFDHVNGFKAIIEVKTHWYPSPTEATPISEVSQIPLKYWLQVQAYLEIRDLPKGFLWSWTLINGNTCFEINRDKEFFNDVIIPELIRFRHSYESKVDGNLVKFKRSEKKRLVHMIFYQMKLTTRMIIKNNFWLMVPY